jgi:hypothetical protein
MLDDQVKRALPPVRQREQIRDHVVDGAADEALTPPGPRGRRAAGDVSVP